MIITKKTITEYMLYGVFGVVITLEIIYEQYLHKGIRYLFKASCTELVVWIAYALFMNCLPTMLLWFGLVATKDPRFSKRTILLGSLAIIGAFLLYAVLLYTTGTSW